MWKLFQVPATHIDAAWKDGACKLGEACKRAEAEITPDQLKMLLSHGMRDLVGVVNTETGATGWAAVQFQTLPNIRVLYVYAIYAPGAAGPECFRLLADYAKQGGASSIRGACDEVIEKLWTRRFKAKRLYSICEIDLKAGDV